MGALRRVEVGPPPLIRVLAARICDRLSDLIQPIVQLERALRLCDKRLRPRDLKHEGLVIFLLHLRPCAELKLAFRLRVVLALLVRQGAILP